ncbi:hypothetical protein mRhiFer1_009859 [Rhinolophus ferrumequinum]|uniref:Uncharacterized protein n=1 Tax=Rhinolophus ferrumequinum TaxID=59479 RepID=A0A7J7YS70_RHIFE|nr:hypothetical protein mRhiFer1_009859 [Rhinolophus ferrumequinum]
MNPSPAPQTCFQPGLCPSVTEAGCCGRSWHHLCPSSSLQSSWAPFSDSSCISPPGTDLCGGGGHWASSCAPWSSGQPEGRPANGAEAQFSLGPILGWEQGWSRVAPRRGILSSGDGWKLQFLHPGQGRDRSQGWRIISSQYGKEGGRSTN